MTQPNKTPTRLEKFRQGDGPARLAEILRDPVMIDALEILEEKTEANDTILPGLVRDYKENAPMVIALIHSSQAGQRSTLRRLKALAHKPAPDTEHQDVFSLEPYAHITQDYLEKR